MINRGLPAFPFSRLLFLICTPGFNPSEFIVRFSEIGRGRGTVSASGNYLTRIGGEEQRIHKRRNTNRLGNVYYLRRGVRGYTSQPCKMVNISESGCLLVIPVMSQVPEHLYLVLDGFPAKFPCVTIARSEKGLHLRFTSDLPTEVVDTIARKKFAPRMGANDR